MEESQNTVLIIEDSIVQRKLIERLLKQSGYSVLLAGDGVEGLALARAHHPSLVITDALMPNMGGYEVCQIIKQDPELRDICVLILTALDSPEEVIRGLVVGADFYMTKPVEGEILLEEVHNLMTSSEEERGPGGPDGMLVSFAGESFKIKTGRRQTLNLLLSTYGSAVRKNRQLIQAQQIIREKDAILIESVQEASRAKSEFIANLSHELRTPMNAIIGLTELVLRSNLSERDRDCLEKVMKSSKTLLDCLVDVLDLAKIDAGQVDLCSVPFDLHDLFSNLADMFCDQAANKGIECIFQVPQDFISMFVGDPKRLQQVFINLLRNAIKFTEEGSIIVKVYPYVRTKGPVKLHFSIQDTGIGIESERIDELFKPFSTANSSTSIRYGGSGIGLNISRQLVEMFGGQIWAESTVGKGSIFNFTVVLNCQAEADSAWKLPEHLKNIRILVVDDNEISGDITRATLSDFGLPSCSAASGESAIEEVLSAQSSGRPYDLVLMDWRMPGLDGIETSVCIHEKFSDIPESLPPKIIMLTAFGKGTVRELAKKIGVEKFLSKPVNRGLLFDSILDIFGKKESNQSYFSQKFNEEVQVAARIGGANVLLVEDNSINQQVVQGLLQRVGVDVKTADNGQDALRLLDEFLFDLVLMDLQMPVMDGFETTINIRKDARFSALPIIAVTAHALTNSVEKSRAAGMNDYITKPVDTGILYLTLIKWLNPNGDRPGFGRHLPHPGIVSHEEVLPSKMDGIDLMVAMERFRGEQKFFGKLLMEFNLHADAAHAIKQLLDQKDLNAAVNLVHTVKGMASNLAANDLSHASHLLEDSIEQGKIWVQPELLTKFEREFTRIVRTIQKLEVLPSDGMETLHSDSEYNISDIESRLKVLYNHLKASNLEAEQGFVELKNALKGNSWREKLMRIDACISGLDYGNAKMHLEQIAKDLGFCVSDNLV